MAITIVGRVDSWSEAEPVLQALRAEGFSENDLATYFKNPSGQHDEFPIGGDEDADPEAEDAGGGAAKGAVIGGVAGAALGVAALAIPGVGPLIAAPAFAAAIGTGVGAYTGSVAGAASELGEKENIGERRDEPQATSGVMIAVRAHDPDAEQNAERLLRDGGATEIKRQSERLFQEIEATASQTNEKLI